ncbi:MAG: hypothetical protein QME12_00430 [Nanoarchaeota archaeon]|nr:hypothetical protein [Nanoarchaeota archaeon]
MAGEHGGIIEKRLGALVKNGRLTEAQRNEFTQLEAYMESGERPGGPASFRKTNDAYIPLLEKVLRAMIAIKEPLAEAKYRIFIEEKGTMGPAVFLTPWDMTLSYLDRQIGNLEEVIKFYS